MANVVLSEEQFTTLVGWAEAYGLVEDLFFAIRDFTERIELAQTPPLTRQFLMIRWRDGNARMAAGDWDFPPQSTMTLLRYTTPWTYEEVEASVAAHTANPVSIEVTTDRTGTVGWYDLDTFFDR
jgi:hypothetical protein